MSTQLAGTLALLALALVALSACSSSEATCACNDDTIGVGDKCTVPDANCTCQDNGELSCKSAWNNSCSYKGVSYEVGVVFPAGDDCNGCSCDAMLGSALCTEFVCEGTCAYAGKKYAIDESTPALDGCNTCTCGSSGLSCTELSCACDPEKEWWRSYESKDATACATLSFSCPENAQKFSSACGCGCEQSSACAPSYNCMPPKPCDVPALKKRCPYSSIDLPD